MAFHWEKPICSISDKLSLNSQYCDFALCQNASLMYQPLVLSVLYEYALCPKVALLIPCSFDLIGSLKSLQSLVEPL